MVAGRVPRSCGEHLGRWSPLSALASAGRRRPRSRPRPLCWPYVNAAVDSALADSCDSATRSRRWIARFLCRGRHGRDVGGISRRRRRHHCACQPAVFGLASTARSVRASPARPGRVDNRFPSITSAGCRSVRRPFFFASSRLHQLPRNCFADTGQVGLLREDRDRRVREVSPRERHMTRRRYVTAPHAKIRRPASTCCNRRPVQTLRSHVATVRPSAWSGCGSRPSWPCVRLARLPKSGLRRFSRCKVSTCARFRSRWNDSGTVMAVSSRSRHRSPPYRLGWTVERPRSVTTLSGQALAVAVFYDQAEKYGVSMSWSAFEHRRVRSERRHLLRSTDLSAETSPGILVSSGRGPTELPSADDLAGYLPLGAI